MAETANAYFQEGDGIGRPVLGAAFRVPSHSCAFPDVNDSSDDEGPPGAPRMWNPLLTSAYHFAMDPGAAIRAPSWRGSECDHLDVMHHIDQGCASPFFCDMCNDGAVVLRQWMVGSDGLSKTFPDVPSKFDVSSRRLFGCGSAYHEDLEQLPVDWESGIIRNCRSPAASVPCIHLALATQFCCHRRFQIVDASIVLPKYV